MGDRRPIVVGGCHRSGTSLVRRILDTHPSVHCGPELTFFRDFAGDFRDDPLRHLRFSRTARSFVDEEVALRLLGRAFLELHEIAATAAGKPRWADKSPDNAIHLDGWRTLLGDAWLYVHVVRNPLDTIASMTEAGFPLTLPPDLDGRIDFYNRYVSAGTRFAEDNRDRAVVVGYDNLVADPGGEIARLMDALGERSVPAQLAFNRFDHQAGLEDPKIAATADVHDRSVGRWRDLLGPAEVAAIRDRTTEVWERAQALARQPMAEPSSRKIDNGTSSTLG